MTAKQLVVTIPLDSRRRARLERAAKVQGQSLSAFVEGAAEELARRVLLAWAIDRYIDGDRSFGELAQETGLTIEEIMAGMEDIGDRNRAEALAGMWDRTREDADEIFLASARTMAHLSGDPEILRRAERAVTAGAQRPDEPSHEGG